MVDTQGHGSLCSPRLRLLGLLPLVFYGIHVTVLARMGWGPHAWWICHVNNLALAAGLLFAWAPAVGVALVWLILAFPFWLFEVFALCETPWTSILTHVGGLALGLALLPRLRLSRHTWWWALALFLVLQHLTRHLCPPDRNVNFAHAVRPEVAGVFPNYPVFFLTFTAAAGVGLFLVQWGLRAVQGRLLRREEPEGDPDADPDPEGS